MIYATEQQVVVTAVLIVVVAVVALFVGIWYGVGRGREEGEADAREQAKARRAHPVYRQPPEIAHADGPLGGYLAARMVPMPDPITTGEIQAITDEMDAWIAQHVYAAPADYGQWLERQDGHAVRDG